MPSGVYARPEPQIRFWSKVNKDTDHACWIWKAGVNNKGYGQFWFEGKLIYAHRVAYELTKGPIPEGLTIDHLCRNRVCVNPDHMEPVTNGENVLRGVGPSAINSRKTLCPRGHPLFGKDLYVYPNGKRTCRACARIRDSNRRRIRRGEVTP